MWKDIWAAPPRHLTFDTNSSFLEAHPSTNVAFVRPNAYQAGRANITVYNHQNLSSVSVGLSSTGLTTGQWFRVRNAQNYFGTPALGATKYTGQSVSLSTNLTVATPIGMTYTPASSSLFSVYVVEPVAAVSISGAIVAQGGNTPCIDLELASTENTFYTNAAESGGAYSFTDIPVGEYTLTPVYRPSCVPGDPVFTPGDIKLTLTENLSGVNFLAEY